MAQYVIISLYRDTGKESIRERQKRAVTTGYYGVKIIPSGRPERCENAAWEKVRLGAPGWADENRDFFSILLDIWNLPVNRSPPRIGKISVDDREAPASEKLSD